jgi:signal transduction histidine kinase
VIALAIVVAATSLVAGVGAGIALRQLPTLRLQLGALALVAAALPLTAVVVAGVVMFHANDDRLILALTAAASTAAVLTSLAVARSLGRSLDPLRTAARKLAAGDLAARSPLSGPAEVREVAQAFNAMGERLEELFDARSQLVAWASHDLRTPLASIQAMLEAVDDGLAPPEEYLPALRSQTRTLALLVDDLFELARIDAGALTLELHEARLSGVVDTCLTGLEAEASARGVQLEADVGDVEARCAPEKVERVLLNLVTNALRHTPADGSVAVRARPVDGEVHVSVEDTGRGFDRTLADGGTGLGLAIARGFVEAQGGRMWVEPRPEGGSRVSFTLPRP